MRLARLMILVSLLLLAACESQGSNRVAPDRFDYNQAIARSANEQMLLNLVRLRYGEVPVFLSVSSVLTQYVWTGSVSVNGAAGQGATSILSVGGAASTIYVERPTITYAPLTGQEFATQLLTPIEPNLLFGLMQSGWPPEQLTMMGVQRLHDARSLPFDTDPAREVVAQIETFRTAVSLFIDLAKREAVELHRDEDDPEQETLVFETDLDPETQTLVDELKRTIGLAPAYSAYRVTTKLTRQEPDEITIRVRSLLDLMGFLSRGVEIPEAHLAVSPDRQGRPAEQIRSLVPLRVRAVVERPEMAFAAVQYHDHWYYIDAADHRSKQAFGLLTYLFQLQAPQAPTAGPLLTVPTG